MAFILLISLTKFCDIFFAITDWNTNIQREKILDKRIYIQHLKKNRLSYVHESSQNIRTGNTETKKSTKNLRIYGKGGSSITKVPTANNTDP